MLLWQGVARPPSIPFKQAGYLKRNKMRIMMWIIFIVFWAFVIGANIYLSKRFAFYFSIEKIRAMYILFASITVFLIGGMIAFTNATGILSHILFSLAAIGMGAILYLILSVLLVDLVSVFYKTEPRFYGLAALVITVIVSGYGILNASNIRTTKIEIPVPGVQHEVKAMHLTDIHIGHFRGKDFLQRIVNKTIQEDVDVVFLTGDLFDGKIRLNDESLEPLKQLDIPIYFVEGNHDGYSGSEIIKENLREIGVHVLENEVAHWNGLQIIGLNHMLADENSVDMHATGVYSTIKETLPQLETIPGKPTILLHHSPDGIKYASEKGVDLYLAGHTHAGQMFPINLIAKKIFDYNKGLHNFNGTKLFVSEGVGTFGPPMRIGTKSEIVTINIIPEL